MSLFRSNKMGYYSLIASHEFAWDILNTLGESNSLQFIDLNAQETSFNRPFSNYVKRCEDLESKLGTIENYMNLFKQPILRCENAKEFLQHLREAVASRNRAEWTYLDDVEAEIDQKMGALSEQIKSYENLVDEYNHLIEFREVLIRTRPYIHEDGIGSSAVPKPEDMAFLRRDIRFNYLAGVINKEDSLRFRRILFRITRGMTWTVLMDIEKPKGAATGRDPRSYFIDSSKAESKDKTVFLVIYQGGQHEMLKGKLNKICDSFGASKYGIPEDLITYNKKRTEIEVQLKDSESVVATTRGHIETVLQYFSVPRLETHSYSNIEGLRLFLAKEKILYHNLNMMKYQNTLLRGNCWCPLERVEQVQSALADLKARKGGMGSCEFQEVPVPGGISPPTHFETNEYTGVFQEIVNTYGIPRYREINPGLFTIATFPFLFGVMFGDISHGILLFTAGLYLIFWKDSIEKDKETIWRLALPARYLLTFQGFFALYCGLIYNDFTSLPFNLFGTCYNREEGTKTPGCTYPFGIDPAWYGSVNELTFLNSFKMKLSVILGVTQMLFGIVLRGLNSIHTKKWLDFWFEFIPMLIFMSVTFGYMVALIFIKWSIAWVTPEAIHASPSIITIFIKMALSPGKWDPTIGTPLYGDAEGRLQATVQLFFLLAALVCAVLILVPKPLILYFEHKNQTTVKPKYDPSLYETDHEVTESLLSKKVPEDNQLLIAPQPERQIDLVRKAEHGEHPAMEGEHFDMGEIFVHQVIETIEFVLGSISNTASYLRLWALSLAHSQLAKVFFSNSLGRAIQSGNLIMAFFCFWLFANITLGVLMLMDQMECFLHALRLHWVEFQNKFYKADGYAFVPFSYEKNLQLK